MFVYSRYIDYSTLTYNNTKANTVCGRNYFEIWNTNLIIYSLHIIYTHSLQKRMKHDMKYENQGEILFYKIQKDMLSLGILQHNKNAKEVSKNSFSVR